MISRATSLEQYPGPVVFVRSATAAVLSRFPKPGPRASDVVHLRAGGLVLVLHDINFASWYSDHIVAMKAGKVAAQGSADAMIRPEVLSDIYDMEIKVHEIGGQRISVYYG